MSKKFNNFRFEGLNHHEVTNQYFSMNRVNDDETKIVVKVAEEHLIETKYGYALILDENHVVFLKPWAVDCNWFGNEVILSKQYFNVKEWGDHSDNFFADEDALTWEFWLNVAKEQVKSKNHVKWHK